MSEVSKPLEALKCFMDEMCKWEKDFLDEKMMLIDQGKATLPCNDKYKKLLEYIFSKFSVGDSKTLARMELPGASSPVMYDPKRDNIYKPEVVKGKVRIVVQQAEGFESKFLFTMVCVGDEWKIERKDTFRNGKWEKSSL